MGSTHRGDDSLVQAAVPSVDLCFDLDAVLTPTDDLLVSRDSSLLLLELAVAAMPTTAAVGASTEAEGGRGVCAVCMEEYSLECKRMPCLHVYHAACIVSWLAADVSSSCPVCRRRIYLPIG